MLDGATGKESKKNTKSCNREDVWGESEHATRVKNEATCFDDGSLFSRNVSRWQVVRPDPDRWHLGWLVGVLLPLLFPRDDFCSGDTQS
jgi:hypothetical protein